MGDESKAPVTVLVGLFGCWIALQVSLWAVPPFSDALGHIFPQANLLLTSHWSFQAVAASPAAEHPPLVTALVAAGWSLFGVGILWPHVLSTTIGALALVGVFRLGCQVTSPVRALAAAVCVGLSPVFFAQCANPYLEIAMVAGLVWALYFFFSKNAVGVGVCLAVMMLAKETSIPLAAVLGLVVLWRGRRSWADVRWDMVVAVALSPLPCLAWLLYAAVVKGGFMTAAVTAAATNGSVAPSAVALLRKLALGPVQLLVMGFWVPLAVQLGSFALARWRRSPWTAATNRRSRLVLLLVVAGTSIVEHGVVSIGLNRYYLPALSLLWIVTWATLPTSRASWGLVFAGTVVWSSVSYFTLVRYATFDDGFAGVQAALAHRRVDRRLETLYDGRPVVTSYPTTVELSYPEFGYVTHAIPVIDADRILPAEPGGAWVVLSNAQMNHQALRDAVARRGLQSVLSVPYISGTVTLFQEPLTGAGAIR